MERSAGRAAPGPSRERAARVGSVRGTRSARRLRDAALARLPGVRRVATATGAIAALSADAWACPYCALSQGVETLVFILGFLAIPYIVVSAVMVWMKRVVAREREELAALGDAPASDGAAARP